MIIICFSIPHFEQSLYIECSYYFFHDVRKTFPVMSMAERLCASLTNEVSISS